MNTIEQQVAQGVIYVIIECNICRERHPICFNGRGWLVFDGTLGWPPLAMTDVPGCHKCQSCYFTVIAQVAVMTNDGNWLDIGPPPFGTYDDMSTVTLI